MCSTCGRGERWAPAGSGELLCEQCGRISADGCGFRAEVVPDDAVEGETRHAGAARWCNECWRREFGE
jgi:hypothetical protein